MVIILSFFGVVVVDGVEEVGVEVCPFLEGEFFSEDAWCHVFGYECGLDGYCSRAAHGVDEVGVGVPSCHEYDAGSEHFVEWSLDALLSVAASV